MGAIRADRAGISAGDVFALICDDLVHTCAADIGRTTDLSRTAVASQVRELVPRVRAASRPTRRGGQS